MTFFPRSGAMPVLLAVLMGLQHAFAMLGGLITPPYVIAKFSIDFGDVALQQYAIAAALIVSGICTIMNCVQIPLPGGYKLGTGVLSVVGTSFTFLPIIESAVQTMKAEGCADAVAEAAAAGIADFSCDGNYEGRKAYGRILGTVLVCSLFEVGLSFVPFDKLRKAFPPLVSGITVMLIGASLTGTGMKYWGGGAVCADMSWKLHAQVASSVGFGDAPVSAIPSAICSAGEVQLPFGSTELIGLGFSVFAMLVLIELFGSPFMKNCNVVISLLFGYFVAGVSRHCVNGADGSETCLRYIVDQKIKEAEPVTFLWAETFPLGFYAPAVFPLLICYIVTTVETIGDIRATYEASYLETDTEEYGKSIQGGILSDGVCSFFAALATSMPNTTFSQNNGVIALTKCASKWAGVACGAWLILMGILAKISGIISSIPDAVLGGMTTFLFCNVFVSGLKVVSSVDLSSRRNRFILAVSMGVGLGVAIVPNVFGDMRASSLHASFWPCTDCDKSERAVRSGILLFLNTPYCVGSFLAMLLNAILPSDPIIVAPDGEEIDAISAKSLPTKVQE